jgi:hypothetical protein
VKYLFRDDKTGFRQMDGEPLGEKRMPFRPWALTPDGRVVYAEWKQQGSGLQGIFELALGRHQGGVPLRSYDKQVSQMRRREFETELARDAGSHSGCFRPAVDLVTTNLIAYVDERQPARVNAAGGVIKTRCYNDTGSGRLGNATTGRSLPATDAWQTARDTLAGNDIPKILGVQVALANTLTKTLGFDGNREQIFRDTANKVAPSQGSLYSWFDLTPREDPQEERERALRDGVRRGRQKSAGAQPTSAPGLTSPGVVTTGDGAEERKRGIDEWTRVEGSGFVKGIDMRNMVFGAGRSGTTGDLLKTYRTFGMVDDGESLKQYLLAIVVYLVTGGHHTCHEIFSVANLLVGSNGPQGGRAAASVSTLVKDAYVPGKYIKHLPDSYISTGHFEALREKYYDIAMLGHLHGTFV